MRSNAVDIIDGIHVKIIRTMEELCSSNQHII